MKKLLVFLCTIFLVLGVFGSANATFYTDESLFISSNSGLTTIDFEDIAAVGTATAAQSSLTFGDVTFSGTNLRVADKDFVSGDVYGQPEDMLFSDYYGGPLDMFFSPNVDVIGFLIAPGHLNTDVAITLYDGLNNILDTQTVLAHNMNVFDTFVGWDGLGSIDNLHISIGDAPEYINIDNVRYSTASVPEPSTMLLLGSGLIGLGFLGRKKLFKK